MIYPSVAPCLVARPSYSSLPLVCSWQDPLPLRSIRPPGKPKPLGRDAPAGIVTGPLDRPFDFSGHVRRLYADIATRCAKLRHIDVSRLLIGVTQARSGRAFGLQARVTPLRFQGGRLLRRRRGVTYQVQRYLVGGYEMLYLVTFCLPRFLDQEFDDKLVTLFHELYHIGPAFDGDLRRHAGRCQMHTHSKRAYDRHMAGLAKAYLDDGADPDLHAFLRLNFAQLHQRHGGVVGVVVPRPKLIPVPDTA